MLRTVGEQPTLWESILPAEVLGMPAELEAVDRLLDDPRFFEPYRAFFHARLGRPSIPMETYLRLMFLKYRYRLGFEPLCREVADSITWQRFCRIPLGRRVPHPTTLMKITTRCGETRGRRVERGAVGQGGRGEGAEDEPGAGRHHGGRGERGLPDGLGAVGQGRRQDGGDGRRSCRRSGLATRTRFADRTRSVRRAGPVDQREPAAPQRRQARRGAADQRASWPAIAERSARQADAVVRNARRALRAAGRTRVAAGHGRWSTALETAGGSRRQGRRPDPPATRRRRRPRRRPGSCRCTIPTPARSRKGRLGKPVEFGYKAQLVDNEDGVIVDHNVEVGNPPDAPMLDPAIERITRRTGRAPRAVTADRGYGEATRRRRPARRRCPLRRAAHARANRTPPAARSSNRRAFRKMVRWRTGCEGRISCAKRDFGLDRTRIDGLARRPNLVRPRHLRPQPRQDRRPHHMNIRQRPTPRIRREPPPTTAHSPISSSGRSSERATERATGIEPASSLGS